MSMPQLHSSTPAPARPGRRQAADLERPVLRVLLVEDSSIDAEVASKMLGQACPDLRLEIGRANSLATGLDLLEHLEYDVTLLDLGLPDADPRTVIDSVLSACDPGCAVIALTGQDDPGMVEDFLRRSGEDYLVKGRFGVPELRRAVRFAQSRSARRREEHATSATLALCARQAAAALVADQVTRGVARPHADARILLGMALDGLRDLGRAGPPAHREAAMRIIGHVEAAARCSRTARATVTELMSFAIPATPPGGPTDPLPAVQWAVHLAEGYLPRGVHLETDLRRTPPVSCSDDVVASVAISLLYAAIESFPDGGVPPGAGGRIRIRLAHHDGLVLLEVADTGRGMTQAERNRALNALGDHALDSLGPGIGLFGVKDRVQRARGSMQMRTSPGGGTRVRVRLPTVSGSRVSHAPEPAALRVLVLDVGASTRWAVPRMLPDAEVLLRDGPLGDPGPGDGFDLVLCGPTEDPERLSRLQERLAPRGTLAMILPDWPSQTLVELADDRGIALIQLPFTRADLPLPGRPR